MLYSLLLLVQLVNGTVSVEVLDYDLSADDCITVMNTLNATAAKPIGTDVMCVAQGATSNVNSVR